MIPTDREAWRSPRRRCEVRSGAALASRYREAEDLGSFSGWFGCPDVQSLTRGYILAYIIYIYIIYIIMCVCLIVVDDIYLHTHIYIYMCVCVGGYVWKHKATNTGDICLLVFRYLCMSFRFFPSWDDQFRRSFWCVVLNKCRSQENWLVVFHILGIRIPTD
jgi:hypothetical protein